MSLIICIHSLTKSQNLINAQIFIFLSHLLSHVFPNMLAVTQTPTHTYFSPSLSQKSRHMKISYYTFLNFLTRSHAYSVTHNDMLKVSHSYSPYHSLTHTHSVWMNPGPRILQYKNCWFSNHDLSESSEATLGKQARKGLLSLSDRLTEGQREKSGPTSHNK